MSLSSHDAVFQRLLVDIVSGRRPVGANLPPERELAQSLGASRPTLREALRRLGEWGLVASRRGSGVAVRDRREWSIDVLPAYLLHGAARDGAPAVGALVRDLLALRRAFLIDVLTVVAPRLGPGSLGAARDAVATAWSVRADPAAYVRADFEVLRAVVEAARFLPGLWVLNSLGGVYLELAATLHLAGTPPTAPADYREENLRILEALERADARAAIDIATAYLAAHDRALLDALGVPT